MTRSTTAIAVLLAAAGSAVAQDSVLSTFGSDALSPFLADNQQGANYVVDLTSFETSWGTKFGIAPILKTTRTDPLFNNNLGSAQSLSRGANLGVSPMGGNYQLWNGVGGGINAAAGQTSSLINPPANVNRMAGGLNEFGFDEYNGIVGGMIEFDPAAPGRLFIARRHIAQSKDNAADLGDSSIGGLSVNANGNFFYRADGGFPAVTGPNPYVGNNIHRTSLSARNAGTNQLSLTGAGLDVGANTWIAQEHGNVISAPNFVPNTNVFGSATFGSEHAYGSTAGGLVLAVPNSHLVGSDITDHRGTYGSTSRFTLATGGVGTFAVIGKLELGAVDNYGNINIWSVGASGAMVGAPTNFIFPQTMADHDATAAGFTYDTFDGGVQDNPASFRSQTSFQGGVGQAAIGMDQQGRGLAALYYTDGGSQSNPDNVMTAVRFDPTAADPTVGAEYAIVAFCYFDIGSITYEGKDITDGAGNVIGQLIPLDGVTGGTPFGPSFSCPAIDSAGNMWFQAAVELYARFDSNGDGTVDALDDVDLVNGAGAPGADGISDWSDTDGALIRAVYDPSNANGPAWELELVLELGSTVTGSNSGVDWRINFMGTADSNSLSSGTFFSSNASEQSFNGFDVSALPTSDSRTNGGVVLNASIVYDVDGDGDFWTDDTAVGNETTLDQDYNVLLYVGNLNSEDPVSDPCDAIDFNNDGFIDSGDISDFIDLFLGGNSAADLNNDGFIDSGDISAFVDLFLSCSG